MAQHIKPLQTSVRVVPRDGELEITLNINITIDNQGVPQLQVQKVTEPEKEDKMHLIPDFSSGLKLNFGKQC